jgi:hypothetical protein
MKEIPIRNKELISILDQWLQALLKVDRSGFPYDAGVGKEGPVTPEYACGEEYLAHMQGKKVDGFPEKTLGVDLMKYRTPYESVANALYKLDTDLLNWSGSRNNAVKMLYPKGGYMGWHHNANASGYNILLSWSEKGTGFFRYQDPVTKEIITMHDSPGWTCKVGYYGRWDEPDRIYWHCASAAHEERVTLGYIIPHEGMWQNMCDDIQTV